MTKAEIKTGVCHRVPQDLRQVLVVHPQALEVWNMLTPLARNEWICWVTIVKKLETRVEHLVQLVEDLTKNGKQRSCCWPGCPHRNPKAAKWFEKRNKISKGVV